jgi:site-specific DNA-methyltransferase (adenine-specific)
MVELTLYHGDCLEVMKELPAQSVDLIICDLPYGCLAGGAGKEKAKRKNKVLDLRYDTGKTKPLNTYGGTLGSCQWDVKINLEEFWKEIRRIRKNEHTPCIHFCTTKFGVDLIQSNPTEFRYDLVWNKEHGVSFLTANKMPMRSHEMIYVFSKAGAFYNRVDIEADRKPFNAIKKNTNTHATLINTQYNANRITSSNDGTTRCALSVINMKKVGKNNNVHPTEKPEGLYRWLIERYCPAGGTVLDPTFGSGNSVFTAYTMGRNAIGIEKDDAFFEKAEQRLNAL